MNATNIIFGVIITAFLGAYATAAPNHRGDHERFPISIAQAEERAQAHFDVVDENGDGVVSDDEFVIADIHPSRGEMGTRMSMQPRHMHAQNKRSQELTQEEREQMQQQRSDMRQAMTARLAEREAKLAAELFSIIDDDGDGLVSALEFGEGSTHENRALAGKRLAFKELDQDASGFLTTEELPSRLSRLRKADSDGDGLVTKDEMRSAMPRHRGDQQIRYRRPGPPA